MSEISLKVVILGEGKKEKNNIKQEEQGKHQYYQDILTRNLTQIRKVQ